jgi:ERF superfamily
MSASVAGLAAALAKAQGAMTHASKDATNPHFKNRYADLAAVWAAIREPLAANGLSVVQTVTQTDGTVGVRSLLLHASGEWIASDLQMPVPQKTPQGYGSALTYARRYSLAALVGIAQDDDDGEAGTRPGTPVLPPLQKRTPAPMVVAQPAPQVAEVRAASPADDPVERALVAIGEAQSESDLQGTIKLVKQLGVAKDGEVRAAFAARQKSLKGVA